MNSEKLKLMRSASYLLPPPGGEVVRECINEIEQLQAALVNLAAAYSHHPSCQSGVAGKCYCVACVKTEVYDLLDAEDVTTSTPPTYTEIAMRLRNLASEMDNVAVDMDYYGGLSEWAKHSREIIGAGNIMRQWAEEIS